MEIWNLKGYTNWTEPNTQARYTYRWIEANRDRYFKKVPFDDFIFLRYTTRSDLTFQLAKTTQVFRYDSDYIRLHYKSPTFCWIGINVPMELAPFFIPSTSFCTLLLVHLIRCISPHHSHRHHSQYLSLPRPFTPDLKLISFTNPFIHSLSGSFWTAITDLQPVLN